MRVLRLYPTSDKTMLCSLKILLGFCVRGVGYEHAVFKAMHLQYHSHASIYQKTCQRNGYLQISISVNSGIIYKLVWVFWQCESHPLAAGLGVIKTTNGRADTSPSFSSRMLKPSHIGPLFYRYDDDAATHEQD
jgi:hypothetical protein